MLLLYELWSKRIIKALVPCTVHAAWQITLKDLHMHTREQSVWMHGVNQFLRHNNNTFRQLSNVNWWGLSAPIASYTFLDRSINSSVFWRISSVDKSQRNFTSPETETILISSLKCGDGVMYSNNHNAPVSESQKETCSKSRGTIPKNGVQRSSCRSIVNDYCKIMHWKLRSWNNAWCGNVW